MHMMWQLIHQAAGPYTGFFRQGGSEAYMPKKVTNIQRIINNDILKIVNIVFSRGQLPPLASPLCTALPGGNLKFKDKKQSPANNFKTKHNKSKKLIANVSLFTIHLQSNLNTLINY
jgi:hypothetical protein